MTTTERKIEIELCQREIQRVGNALEKLEAEFRAEQARLSGMMTTTRCRLAGLLAEGSALAALPQPLLAVARSLRRDMEIHGWVRLSVDKLVGYCGYKLADIDALVAAGAMDKQPTSEGDTLGMTEAGDSFIINAPVPANV